MAADQPQGPEWWLASDGKWYPPEQQPADQSTAAQTPPTVPATVAHQEAPGPGWWLASDGKWYSPEQQSADQLPTPSPPSVEPEHGDHRRLKKSAFRWLLLVIGLTLGMGGSIFRAYSAYNDDPEVTAGEAFTLQTKCHNAGLFYDAFGNCYRSDPALLAESNRRAAIVDRSEATAAGVAATSQGQDSTAPFDPNAPADTTPTDSNAPVGPAQQDPNAPAAPTAPLDPNAPATSAPQGTARPPAPIAPPNPNAPAGTASGGVAPIAPPNPNAPAGTASGGVAPVAPTGPETDPAFDVVIRTPIRMELPRSFAPDPTTVTMGTTGGVVNLGLNLSTCEGWSGSDPDVILNYTDSGGSVAGSSGLPIRVYFEAAIAGGDAGLVINDPYGEWHCNADWQPGSTDPMITIADAGYGVYDIWVGAVLPGTGPSGVITITELPTTPGG